VLAPPTNGMNFHGQRWHLQYPQQYLTFKNASASTPVSAGGGMLQCQTKRYAEYQRNTKLNIHMQSLTEIYQYST
jgi:hypothetical protein